MPACKSYNVCAEPVRKLVWIDIGSGTGWNCAKMNEYIPISEFHTVYLVDITPSLCDVAQKRFDKLGWANVKVLCMDALQFELEDKSDEIEIGLVTMSYSCLSHACLNLSLLSFSINDAISLPNR